MFHSRKEQLPKETINDMNIIDYNMIISDFYKPLGLGENMFSKENNKYMFRLLQIFGFRDEKLVSLFDKDQLK